MTGLCAVRVGMLESKRTVHLEFGAVKRSHSAPAREQRNLREERRRASPAQSEESKGRAPARACSAAARPWVLRNLLCRSRVQNAPVPANCRSQAPAALESLRHL